MRIRIWSFYEYQINTCSPFIYLQLIDYCVSETGIGNDCEDPYPSLSDYHDYEPNLEFDDTELQTTSNNGKMSLY